MQNLKLKTIIQTSKFFLFLFVFLFFGFWHLHEASAHFVKSSGSVGALLHMDPEDDPVAGASSNIILEFKDTEGKFSLNNCECKVVISQDGKEINSINLSPVSESEQLSSVTPFTFPEKNIYQLKILGAAKNNAGFNNFEINYDVRVGRELAPGDSTKNQPSWVSEHVIHLVGAGVVVVFFVIALFIQNKRRFVAVIFILVLLSHLIPIKAIHATHNGNFDSQSFVCCMPVNSLEPPVLSVAQTVIYPQSENQLTILIVKEVSELLFFTRAPPIS